MKNIFARISGPHSAKGETIGFSALSLFITKPIDNPKFIWYNYRIKELLKQYLREGDTKILLEFYM